MFLHFFSSNLMTNCGFSLFLGDFLVLLPTCIVDDFHYYIADLQSLFSIFADTNSYVYVGMSIKKVYSNTFKFFFVFICKREIFYNKLIFV